MKYRFITILHNLKLESVKNKGTEIFPGARVSNGRQILEDTLGRQPMKSTLGVHSVDEFNNKVYFYLDGEFEDVISKDQMDQIGNKYTFFFLRQAQAFAYQLWDTKDNSIYVRDGFLLAYTNRFEDGFTYKASLSEIFVKSTCERGEIVFSDSEISNTVRNFVPATFEDYSEESFGGKLPNSKHLFKAHGSTRMTRAAYFTASARKSHILPLKIVSYCNALECLFTIGTSEVNHKIAERVALMLGNSKESKQDYFKLIKNAYKHRSNLVHGQYLTGNEEALIGISQGLDNILRELLVAEHEVFSMSDNDMEAFFLDLLFAKTGE
ncbi:HEPN domain-containing protein [Neobacillus sp. 179-C4.2 HS]|uniref:HEPN domain-containing protein n=1 Tax=Neobacillus driksii TaxID=3035913 RepID=A0ABV4YUH4_9BACI|nr:HEPN domain-containing protein [Neobacillus sp. 179.-C4.2 HS]MDP5192769.1 HEPN domain-containing protein [Neobacillus sp. 179.-C4.2 HS]